MFDNLKSELARANVSSYMLAQAIHKTRQSVYAKMKNESDWTLREMLAIQSYLKDRKPERAELLTLDYLFKEGE